MPGGSFASAGGARRVGPGRVAGASPTVSPVIATFRLVSFVEAATYLALLSAVVLYRVFDGPNFVRVLGPVHGIVFLVYFVLVLQVRESQRWSVGRTLLVLIAAALPFGGFWVGRDLVEETRTA